MAQTIAVYSDPAGTAGCIDAEPGEYVRLYVVVVEGPGWSPALSSVRFSYPSSLLLGPGGDCGVFYYNAIPVYPATVLVGNDVVVDFGTCVPLPVHVLTMEAFGRSRQDCCFVGIETASGQDCAGNDTGVVTGFTTLVDTICQYIPPANPYPPDGATGVPTDVTFTWSESPGPEYCANIDWYGVGLGKSPGQLRGVYFSGDTFWDPPYLLEEGVTYYWRVTVSGNGPHVQSPVWTFSTTGPLAVQQSTWGRVKALYR